MKKILLLLLVILIGCGNKQTDYHYYDGTQKVEKEINWKDGQQHGPYKWYYYNGQLENEVIFKDGESVE